MSRAGAVFIACVVLMLGGTPSLRADVFYYLSLDDLTVTAGEYPSGQNTASPSPRRARRRAQALREHLFPYVITAEDAEMYVVVAEGARYSATRRPISELTSLRVDVRVPDGVVPVGMLFLPIPMWHKMTHYFF